VRTLHHQDLGRERKAARGAIDILPAEGLEQIVSANGFTSESDYDSDDLPKGPYADGGGEADTPQHCDDCRRFLENPLTGDGLKAASSSSPHASLNAPAFSTAVEGLPGIPASRSLLGETTNVRSTPPARLGDHDPSP
jgi:hypothetical protein